MKVALEQYGDIHVLRWDSYHKSLEDTLAFWIVISKTEMISKSSLRNSTEFKRETSLCSFHKKKKARCLGLYLPGFGNGEGSPFLSPLPPSNLGEDEYDVATRFQLSRSNSEELEMIKASPYVLVFLKSFIGSLAKINLMMRQEAIWGYVSLWEELPERIDR
ncbi:uncharacterized protein EAE98_008852 [Botrytis deweyae]|uniref:Uncharacterized protein n=1 Tax=Botrytis deweyae TaxID=2478750 RepID=A0ABQ7IDM2_9HELO|nr:uncharacterized protein EAE98_008852 [Botrytis deweyae]KAF7920823.1 hypothetical protein EAE98_008852 [Botrytis deweyae]